MHFLKSLFGSKTSVGGLDVGSNAIKLAQIAKTSSGEFQLERIAMGPTPQMALKDGAVVDVRSLGDAIRQLYAAQNFTVQKVDGVVAGQSVVIRPISMTAMTQKELKNAIKFEAERYLPYSVADAQIDGIPLRSNVDGDDKQMEVLLVAAPREMLRNAQEVIKQSGITPNSIDLEPMSLVRALKVNTDPQTFEQTIALINLGANSSSINIFKAGMLRHNRTITVAGNSFTKAIGQSLNLSFDEAEKIKKDKGVIRVEKDATPVAPTTMRIYNVISPVLSELITEVQRSFDYYRSRYRGESVDVIYLSGGTARFKNIDAYIYNELGIQCHIANPFKNISVSGVSGMSAEEIQEMAPSLMVVVGLALRELV
ncbi:MAG: type IV pilus assembly protein PilM [Proteobacteria bacterium]|nr:type IV pilus assembly protein PilM [Pseudomonadota bacterium]